MANYGGLRPKRMLSGSPYNGATNHYSVAAGDGTAIFIGDLVKLAGTSQTINDAVFPDVVQWATGDVTVGVVTAVLHVTRDSTIYREASTQRILLVCDDPNVVFACKEIDTGTALTANDIGLNANLTVGTGSTTSGLSAMQINNATEATTNTLDVKIVGFENRADNVISSTPGAEYLVRINRHQYVNQVAGV